MVFDAPRRARAFFEALVAGNLDVGRPDSVELISTGHKGRRGRRPRSNRSTRQRSPAATPWSPRAPSPSTPASSSTSKTVARCGSRPSSTHPPTCAACAACRTSTQLQAKGRDVNARMLNTERVGQSRVLASPAFERVALPTLTVDGRRAPALRFADPRVIALLSASCFALNTVGFTHRSLRAHVSQLLGADYNTNQMSHDLARLHINALIQRREHTNTYDLTPEDQQAAVFYTKAHDRLLRPPAGSQPTTRTTRATPRPGHHRPTRPHLHRPRPPRKRSLKTQDTSMSSCHQAMASRDGCASTGAGICSGADRYPIGRTVATIDNAA
jgi:hypothetical protein